MTDNNLLKTWNLIWQEHLQEEKRNRLRMLLDGSNLLFFFRYKGDIYGASEASRVTYAKLKDPQDEDNTLAWRKEVNFTATNLNRCIDGEDNQTVFSNKDLKDIHVMSDKSQIEKMLTKHIEKGKNAD